MHSTSSIIEQFEGFHDRDACHHELDVLNMLILSLDHDSAGLRPLTYFSVLWHSKDKETQTISEHNINEYIDTYTYIYICIYLFTSLPSLLMEHILEWETKYPSTNTARDIREVQQIAIRTIDQIFLTHVWWWTFKDLNWKSVFKRFSFYIIL